MHASMITTTILALWPSVKPRDMIAFHVLTDTLDARTVSATNAVTPIRTSS